MSVPSRGAASPPPGHRCLGAGAAMRPRGAVKLLLSVLMVAAAAVITGCSSHPPRAALPAPPEVPGQATGPDLANVTLPKFTMPLVTGGLSMPDPKLTPGAVATTNTTRVCVLPDHQPSTVIPPATQQQVFTEYRIRNPAVQAKYDIDYLVPIGLGGSTSTANMWPAALKGTGFFEKIQLDHVLRDMVCRREISLRRAQRDLERNWYVAWLKYVVATGRA
jgi:hypothetical protein